MHAEKQEPPLLPLPARPPTPSIVSLRHDLDDGDSLTAYWNFYKAVRAVQLTRWLPRRPSRVLDLSGPCAPCARQAAAAGHAVIEVLDPSRAHDLASSHGHSPRGGPGCSETPASPTTRPPAPRLPGSAAEPPHFSPAPGPAPHGDSYRVVAEAGTLGFLADGCVDAVIAENRVLSRHLLTESTVADIARVLRPGGRLFLSVDSLMFGMAILAEQNCWAHLSDVPRAEVVLVPWPDGTITRCFWADQLRELLTDVGLEVEWIRPRTVLSPSTVEHVLEVDSQALPRLVRTELTLPISDESVGIHLIASARRVPV